jgi:hypothetical protein
MISLEYLLECILKKDVGLDKFVSEEEFNKYSKEIALEAKKNPDEVAKKFDERKEDLLRAYVGSDSPFQAICFYMIKKGITKLTKKEFVELYHQFIYIHEQELAKERFEKRGGERAYY